MRLALDPLAGSWRGTNKLWLMPTDPVRESSTTASIESVAGGGFAAIRYHWADDGKAHDGVLLVRNAAEPSDDDMAWVDSFHTGGKIMHFRGEPDSEGRVVGYTTYAVPPGPDWGWRIVLAREGDAFVVTMYNVLPDGQAALAVEGRYARARSDEGARTAITAQSR